MLVAITGTPGVGKSTVAEEMGVLGYIAMSLDKLASQHGFIEGEEDGMKLVNTEKLKRFVKSIRSRNDIFLVSHYAHLMDPAVTIVLRCNPDMLKKRLRAKDWSKDKVQQNIEAEAIDLITIEALENNVKVYEVDTSSIEPRFVVEEILKIVKNEMYAEKFKPGRVDWTEVVLGWY
jgi:adenylate kinase